MYAQLLLLIALIVALLATFADAFYYGGFGYPYFGFGYGLYGYGFPFYGRR